MKTFYTFAVAAIAVGIVAMLFAQAPRGADLTLVGDPETSSESQHAFSAEERSALVKPAVVRIIQHASGTATIPQFKIDFANLSVAAVSGAKPTTIPIDDYFSGTGFAVRSDGYIVTNAHVISDVTVKLNTAGVHMAAELLKETRALSSEAKTKLNEMDTAARAAFGERLADFAIKHSSFTIVRTVRVVRPASHGSDIPTLFAEGYPATIVSAHDAFYRDGKNVGLLKIDAPNLPTLSFGNAEQLRSGMRVYAMEYPEMNDISQSGFTKSRLAQGVVSALKDSRNEDFKIIKTDIEVAHGSGGGPLVDDAGRAVGIIAFETDPLNQTARDTLASAVSAQVAHDMLAAQNIEAEAGPYETHVRQGFAFLHNRHCKQAIEEFKAAAPAGEGNMPHALAEYPAPFIADCASLIASGQSIDTRWDAIRAWWAGLERVHPRFRAASILALTALALFFILWFLKLVTPAEGMNGRGNELR